MSGDGAVQLAAYLLLLSLPLSALIVRRVPLGRTVRLAAVWLLIFVAAVALVRLGRDRGMAGRSRIVALLHDDDQQVSGGEVRIAMAEDGHFYADALVNGVRRHMLVDSGATLSALSLGTAHAAGIDVDESPFPTVLSTANGPVSAKVATVRLLAIGPATARNLRVVVSPAFGDADVLGMNFLSRLKGWRVEGRTLILTP